MPEWQIEPWEPEETIGKLWHNLASGLGAPADHPEAAVELDTLAVRLAVFFRGLGGAGSVEIRPVEAVTSQHRIGLQRRLAASHDRVARASFDGVVLRLPARLSVFKTPEANGLLYFWLTACAAYAPDLPEQDDPLCADLRALHLAYRMTCRVLADCPGLAALYQALCAAHLDHRSNVALPPQEASVEQVIRWLLGGPAPSDRGGEFATLVDTAEPDLSSVRAPRGYRPFRPVPLWPELRHPDRSARSEAQTPDAAAQPPEPSDAKTRRARRKKTEQAERRDSLILHKFEAILSWTEFLNLNRRVDDDDPDTAKKALDDQDELTMGQISKAPATRLKLHLDLAPEDVDRERLAGVHLYPEWDAAAGRYLADHCRVLAGEAMPSGETTGVQMNDPAARRRIRAVRRQFEALRPRRISLPGQPDGDDIDLDAAVRVASDLRATGVGSDRIWRSNRSVERDLCVSILIDSSRSTESAVTGRAVIEIEQEALIAFAEGLAACGDSFAIHAFSSLRRDRVYVNRCKDFSEPMSADVTRRIEGLKPGFYTRLGAAIRHVSGSLQTQARQKRLLMVITDGKPNDLDHYEGRHGIEDSRMAVHEARMKGQSVFGIVIDKDAQAWFARIFGTGGHAVLRTPDHLVPALPQIYHRLVGE